VKKFQFKLQTLLDQRKSRVDMLQAELGEIRREESVELAHLGELRTKLKRAWEMVEAALGGEGASSVEMSQLDDYAKALRDDISVQRLTLEAVRERVEAKRVGVSDAMKQRKVIESLRDRQEHDYIAAQMRAEQNALDDMAALAYARLQIAD
jgi:flagellar FliJ protein